MKKQSGFSLIELMIVVGIVALLSAIAIPAVERAVQNAEDAKTEQELKGIYTAIVTFQTVNNRLPSSWEELEDYISISNVKQKYTLNAGS